MAYWSGGCRCFLEDVFFLPCWAKQQLLELMLAEVHPWVPALADLHPWG